MCDKCVEALRDAQAKAGVEALEAWANGEELPEPPGPPVPLMVCEMGDKVGIMTSRQGWELLKTAMSMFGNVIEIDREKDD